jgi:hypothetical protein
MCGSNVDSYHCLNSPVVKVHGPWVGLDWVNSEMGFLNPLCTHPDATHAPCLLTISRDQTTVCVHIVSSYPACKTWKGRTIHGNLNCHWLESILTSVLTFCDCDMSNSLKLIYTSNSFSCLWLLFHLNHFSHPEEGGIIFRQSVVMCTTTEVKNPKERPSCDNSGHENIKTQHEFSHMVLTCKGCN